MTTIENHSCLNFLNPHEFFNGDEPLDDLLILLPCYKQPHPYTRAFVDLLIQCGADIQFSWGCSDPALHRCIVAGRAWRVLREDEGRHKYLIWIDDDMVGPRGGVHLMRHIVQETNVAISGLYCKRGNQRALAHSLWPEPPREISLKKRPCPSGVGSPTMIPMLGHPIATIDLLPIIGGMGCLMVSRDDFLRHVEQVPNVTKTFPDGVTTDMPGICSSGFTRDTNGEYGWLSEDLVYCQSLWHWASGVYAAPIAWGHVSEVQLAPTPDAVWLHKREPTGEPIPETKASEDLA